jgi:hypothetical protein
MYTGDFGGNLNCSACSPLSSTQVIIYQSCGTELVCAGNLIETPLLATSLVEIGNTKEKNGLKDYRRYSWNRSVRDVWLSSIVNCEFFFVQFIFYFIHASCIMHANDV